jgi:hypothetical protein
MLTWRATRPLKKNMYEVAQILVGRKPGAWWAQREKIEFPILLSPVRVKAPDADAVTEAE